LVRSLNSIYANQEFGSSNSEAGASELLEPSSTIQHKLEEE